MSQPMQPIFIMPEESKQTSGKNAQRNNIAAARAVADAVRSTLGPKGMDKMIVDANTQESTVTNDGVTILREMQIEHPAAKMLVELAKNQEKSVGDGTTTSVVIAGELLKRAEELLDLEIHPTIIAKGYRLAGKRAQEVLRTIAQETNNIHDPNNNLLKKIASTAMTGKGAEANKEVLSKLLVDAVQAIARENKVDLNNIKIEKRVGKDTAKSQLIKGIVLDKERVHPEMPKQVENAKIALLNTPLEIRNTEIDAKIQITSPQQLNLYLEQEERMLKTMVEKIIQSGATVVCCQKGIDELAQHFLAKAGILALRRVRKSDMEKIAKATQGKIINNWKDITQEQLGRAGSVREEKTDDEEFIYIEHCPNPKALTLLLCGTTQHSVEEIARAVEDALGDLAATFEEGKVLAGAGATEIILQRELNKYAQSLQGREQLAVQAFAKALEIIPRTLAENAGIDPIDTLTKLNASQLPWPGINVFTGDVMDAWQEGVIEPLKIKTQALASATEVAEMILRIDDILLAGSSKTATPHNHQLPPNAMHSGMM